ncbi:hypothetical protein ILYODFUR_013893 [Ilyodon furcidens]|uniref:Secreted protein n=1 Tax=Ilyodon furcidens TaxID=33524 RepID=A0ABV0UJY1_9TELE
MCHPHLLMLLVDTFFHLEVREIKLFENIFVAKNKNTHGIETKEASSVTLTNVMLFYTHTKKATSGLFVWQQTAGWLPKHIAQQIKQLILICQSDVSLYQAKC